MRIRQIGVFVAIVWAVQGFGTSTQRPPVLVDVFLVSTVQELKAWADGYSSSQRCINRTTTPKSCQLEFTAQTASTFRVAKNFSRTYVLGGSNLSTLSLVTVADGFLRNGQAVQNKVVNSRQTQTVYAPALHTVWSRIKSRIVRYAIVYTVTGQYSDGSVKPLNEATTVYNDVTSALLQSRKCDERSGWCSNYF